ncbi:MAG TPA: hypothetical protein VGQ00_00085, partial [Candidatus Norongarragalinales archaeon]|nr:hypothetical protein [Candidatus Norongarragalinales archaeon]
MKTKIAIIAILLFLSLLPTSARAISEDQSIAILENTAKTDTSLSTTDRTAILNALTSVRINLAAAKKLDAEAQVLDALVAAEKAGIGTNPVFATAHLVNVARGKEFDITELERESKGAGAIARCLRAGVSWQDLKSVIRTSNAEDFLNIGDGCLLEVAGTAENFRAGVIKVKALYSNTKSPDVLPLPLGDYVFGMDAFFRNNAIASVLDEEQTSGRLMSDREWAVRLFAASDAYANQGEYALAMSVLQRVRDWYGDDATTTFSAMTNHDRDGIELLALCTQGVGGGPGATLNQIRDFTARYKLGDKLDQEATAIKNCMEPSQTEIVNAPVSGQEGITRYDVALQTKVDALGRAMFTNPVWLAQLLDANVKDKNAAILKVRDAVRAFEARKSIVKGAGGLPADATNWDVMALATVRQQKYIGFQQSTRTTPITQLGEVAHGTFLCVGSFLDLPFLALGLVSGGLGYVGKLAMSSYIAVEASISTTESVSRWTTLSLTEKTQTVCGATVGLIASTHVFKTIPKAAEQLSKTEPARFAEKRVVARVAEAVKTGFIKARPALERVTLKLPSALRPKFQTYLARLDALDSAVLQCSGCVIVNGQTRIEANKVFGDTVAEQLEAIRSEKYLPTFKELEASANAIRSVEFRTISTATDLDVYIKDVASITEPDVVIPKSLLQAFADQRVLVAKEFYFRNARLKVLYPDAQDRIDIRYSRWLDPNIDYFNSEVGAVGKDVSGFAYAINQIPGPKIFLYRGAADLQLMTETAALAADIKPQTSGWSFNRKMLL